jgi:hypothetical protein
MTKQQPKKGPTAAELALVAPVFPAVDNAIGKIDFIGTALRGTELLTTPIVEYKAPVKGLTVKQTAWLIDGRKLGDDFTLYGGVIDPATGRSYTYTVRVWPNGAGMLHVMRTAYKLEDVLGNEWKAEK